jgi:hypothetical protein
VSYEATVSQFKIILTNRTNRALKLKVEARQFHGRIIVTSATGKPVEYFDSAILPFLLMGGGDVADCTVPRQGKITWTIPARQLCDIYSNPLELENLQGAILVAKLDELAVVPSGILPWKRDFISDNAKQVSEPIIIPNQAQ